VSDAAGNPAEQASRAITTDTSVGLPTINASITDQANTVSGTGEVGAVVTVREGGTVIGTAGVRADGTWSLVAPVDDGAELTATQTDVAGNVSVASGPVTTVTDTDGDGTANTTDTDEDGDGISDATEASVESSYTINTTTTAATSVTFSGSPTTGYVVTDNSADGLINIVAVAPGENITLGEQGTVSNFFIDFNTVATESLQNMAISLSVDTFDDGLFVAINGTTIVRFDFRDYVNNTVLHNTFGQQDLGSGGLWEPWANEGNPVVEIDPLGGTVRIMVDRSDGTGREDILTYMETGGFDPTPNAVPTIDFEAGVTISTAFRNRPTQDGAIGEQTITVTGQYVVATDIDGDGIINSLDIDTDGDRIWDKYEGAADTDGDGVADYRDTDSNGGATGTDASNASLTSADIAALEDGGTATDRVDASGVYTNGAYSNQFILLTDAVDLDFTAIDNGAFSGVEYIDMADGTNAQTVTLTGDEVIALTGAANELIILRDTNDIVDLSEVPDQFTDTGSDRSIQGRTFSIYEADVGGTIASLLIEDGGIVTLA
jgi:hypothetical protein